MNQEEGMITIGGSETPSDSTVEVLQLPSIPQTSLPGVEVVGTEGPQIRVEEPTQPMIQGEPPSEGAVRIDTSNKGESLRVGAIYVLGDQAFAVIDIRPKKVIMRLVTQENIKRLSAPASVGRKPRRKQKSKKGKGKRK